MCKIAWVCIKKVFRGRARARERSGGADCGTESGLREPAAGVDLCNQLDAKCGCYACVMHFTPLAGCEVRENLDFAGVL